MNDVSKPTGRQRTVTVDRCLDWCLMAYAETRTKGYFVASKFDIGSTEQLLPAATRCKLVLEEKKPGEKRARKVWHDVLTVPKLADAEKLYDAYVIYTGEQKARAAAKAAKAKEEKLKKLAAKHPAKEQKSRDFPKIVANQGAMFHKGTTTRDYLIRIEAKVNRLLEIWDVESSGKKS